MLSVKHLLFCTTISVLLTACGGGSDAVGSAAPMPTTAPATTTNPPATETPDPETPAVDQAQIIRGEAVFISPNPQGNVFSCGTCHSISEPASDGLRRAGHPLGNATKRSSYKNGQLSHMLDAANSCLTEWMNAPGWNESSEDWQDLYAYLDIQTTQSSANVSYEIVDPPADLGDGNVLAGQNVFNSSCVVCHGDDGAGTDIGPRVAGIGLPADYIARRIRLSGRANSQVYAGLLGGIMPFWSADRLSDMEIRDIVAFLEQPVTDDGDMDTDLPSEEDTVCDADHPMVGQVAVLQEKFHDVSGQVRVKDNCTLQFDNFNFDGGGIIVEIYGGINNVYHRPTGFPISPNLFGDRFSNESFELTLPANVSLDDFDGISVWCSAVGVSFGDGLFQ